MSVSFENAKPHASAESFVFVPINESRALTLIKTITYVALSALILFVNFYFFPKFFENLYYAFFYHKKKVQAPQESLELPFLMNYQKLACDLNTVGWSKGAEKLSTLVSKKRQQKIVCKNRMHKILSLFLMAQNQKHEIVQTQGSSKKLISTQSYSGSINQTPYAFTLSCGIKPVMEDIAMVESFKLNILDKKEEVSSFIIMDGHGIQKGSEPINCFMQKNFIIYLKKYLEVYLSPALSIDGVYESFKAAFSDIIQNYHYGRSGTTFVGIFFIANVVFSISVGDSRILYFDQKILTPLNLLADPKHPYFAEKLKKIGAKVFTSSSSTRVEGTLNMAAAIGDKRIVNKKEESIIKPSMSFIAFPKFWLKNSSYLVLGSDGVFDHLKNEQIKSILSKSSELEKKTENLVTLSFNQGSHDNLSSMIIRI